MTGVVRVELVGYILLPDDREIRLETRHRVEVEYRQTVVFSRASDRLDVCPESGMRCAAGVIITSAVEGSHYDDDLSGILLDEAGIKHIQRAAKSVVRFVFENPEWCVDVHLGDH